MGLSENRVYSQWNSHLIGIMISKTIGLGVHNIFRHTHIRLRWTTYGVLQEYGSTDNLCPSIHASSASARSEGNKTRPWQNKIMI